MVMVMGTFSVRDTSMVHVMVRSMAMTMILRLVRVIKFGYGDDCGYESCCGYVEGCCVTITIP